MSWTRHANNRLWEETHKNLHPREFEKWARAYQDYVSRLTNQEIELEVQYVRSWKWRVDTCRREWFSRQSDVPEAERTPATLWERLLR